MPWPDWPILRRLARLGAERGDVPGWVLITAMTVALIMCSNTPTFSVQEVRGATRALPADQQRSRRTLA